MGFAFAVNEKRKPVLGSISLPPTAETAWINHYHHKSDEEYFAKASRKSVLDQVGIRYQNRNLERHAETETRQNAVTDTSAPEYYANRLKSLNCPANSHADQINISSSAVAWSTVGRLPLPK